MSLPGFTFAGRLTATNQTMNHFPDITKGVKALAITALIMLPLAAWQLAEIILWVVENVQISIR